ncbi:glycerol-3-phosphate 1-O-acyltransferase PlsY [Legionella waltersii]
MGSINSAIIVCRLLGLPDPREEGSKNPGATNVLRIGGKQTAAIVMGFDVLKGILPVVLAKYLDLGSTATAFTALAAVLGHMYPVFFQFRGGKGVATAIGALLAFHFIIGVMVIATWLLVANFFRYSSLASICAIVLAPFYSMILIGELNSFPPIFFIALFVLYKHKDNITRLIDGTEPKIKFKHTVIEEIMESEPAEDISPHEVPESEMAQSAEKAKPKKAPATKATTEKKESKPKAAKTTKAKVEKTAEPAKKPKATKPKAATKTTKKKE